MPPHGTCRIVSFISFKDKVGDKWKEYYNVTPRIKKSRPWTGKKFPSNTEKLEYARSVKRLKMFELAKAKIEKLTQSGIDKTQYGWIQKASVILEIAPQSVVRYMKNTNLVISKGRCCGNKPHEHFNVSFQRACSIV